MLCYEQFFTTTYNIMLLCKKKKISERLMRGAPLSFCIFSTKYMDKVGAYSVYKRKEVCVNNT